MSFEGARFDLTQVALPILTIGIVALGEGIEFESCCGVTKLHAPQHPETPVDVFALHGGFEFFEAQKKLLIQRAQTIETLL